MIDLFRSIYCRHGITSEEMLVDYYEHLAKLTNVDTNTLVTPFKEIQNKYLPREFID